MTIAKLKFLSLIFLGYIVPKAFREYAVYRNFGSFKGTEHATKPERSLKICF